MANTITGAALGHSRTTPHCRRHSNTVARATHARISFREVGTFNTVLLD
jgi:hypothetical protein